MKRMNMVCAALAALSLSASAAAAASLTVVIAGVSDKGGSLLLSVIDEKNFPPGSKPIAARKLAATPGDVSVTFENVPEGELGVRVLQDLNGNGKMDFKFGFLPGEPYGFSNNPNLLSGPPSWEQVKFQVKPGANPITIRMK
jgi:uncharacterized protein (DUF2141 family)